MVQRGEKATDWRGEGFASTGSGFISPDPNEPLTFCYWLKDDDTNSRWDDDLLWKITSNDGDQVGSFCDTDGEVFLFTAGDNTVNESSSSVLDGSWHHVAFVYEQSDDRMTLYLDGEVEYRIDYADTLDGMQTTALMFGNNGNDGWKQYDGGLDDYRLYRQALSDEEVARIASQ